MLLLVVAEMVGRGRRGDLRGRRMTLNRRLGGHRLAEGPSMAVAEAATAAAAAISRRRALVETHFLTTI